MTRDIRFRAWDKIDSIMIYDFHAMRDWEFFSDESKYSLMQYTGLKDKNGEEIYEGDIIETDGSTLSREPVEFIDAQYPELLWSGDQGVKESNRIEVIGNIHENPELLK